MQEHNNVLYIHRAPEDCLQYFYGEHMHTVTSFNWDGSSACSSGCMLSDQLYTTCFRPEKGKITHLL
jgi:hypothetical protein